MKDKQPFTPTLCYFEKIARRGEDSKGRFAVICDSGTHWKQWESKDGNPEHNQQIKLGYCTCRKKK